MHQFGVLAKVPDRRELLVLGGYINMRYQRPLSQVPGYDFEPALCVRPVAWINQLEGLDGTVEHSSQIHAKKISMGFFCPLSSLAHAEIARANEIPAAIPVGASKGNPGIVDEDDTPVRVQHGGLDRQEVQAEKSIIHDIPTAGLWSVLSDCGWRYPVRREGVQAEAYNIPMVVSVSTAPSPLLVRVDENPN